MLIGVEHADQNLTRAQQGHLVDLALASGERPPHLEQDVRVAMERGGIVHQLRARVAEALVGEPGAFAGARFDQHVDAATDQALDGVRRRRDAQLVQAALLGDSYLSSCFCPSRHGSRGAFRRWVAEASR